MQAIRQIVKVKNQSCQIVLPDDFQAETVEVIILPVEEKEKKSALKNSQKFAGAISKETADKLHKHLNQIRDEWERDTY